MKLGKAGIENLAKLICDDNGEYKYRTFKDLSLLFSGNIIPSNEIYSSRRDYCMYALNNIQNLEVLIKEICDVRNFENKTKYELFLRKIEGILKVDGISILNKNGNLSLEKLTNNISIEYSIDKQDILSLEYIKENIEKAKEKVLNNDCSGAITNSRTLLEQVVRDLSSKLEIEYTDNNFKKAFDNLRVKLNLDPKNYELDSFKKIISGLVSIIDGLNEVRNRCSDGHSRIYNPSNHHAKLCINSALSVAEFLVESYLYQENKKKKI